MSEQVCYILLANSRVCGRVTGAMPLLTLQVAKFEAISLNRWQSHWGGQRHFHFCTFGAVCKDAWDRQHLTASYYKLLEVISCWIDAWDSQHHTGFLYHSYGGMVDMWHRNICWSIWALIYSIAGQRQDGHHHRRIQQEEVVWSVVSSCVFLFAWQVMAEGDQSASAAQARSLSGSKHIGQWLLELVHAEFQNWFEARRGNRENWSDSLAVSSFAWHAAHCLQRARLDFGRRCAGWFASWWWPRGCRLVASHLCHADACPQTEESHLAGVHGASGGAFTQRPSYLLARTDWQVGNQSCFDAGAAAVLACLWCIASILTQCSASGT